jgi:hypothetical protein
MYASALKDLNASVKVFARDPETLYVRGLAEMQLGNRAGAAADIAAAKRLQQDIAVEYLGYGLRSDGTAFAVRMKSLHVVKAAQAAPNERTDQ